ncbi:Chaperone DnaJ-domain superfamily protein [Raphanus sativus]|nr:Chaperone DnaJ-domain superfamily protein [Raphanus sativus]
MLSSSPTFFAPPSHSSSSPPLSAVPQRLSATPSLYEILEIPIGSTSQEIKSAYRRLARTCHPDVAGNDRSSADAFVKVHAAYCTLSDPEKRAVYDRKILRSLTLGVSKFGSYGGGNWETDQCW